MLKKHPLEENLLFFLYTLQIIKVNKYARAKPIITGSADSTMVSITFDIASQRYNIKKNVIHAAIVKKAVKPNLK